MMEVITMKLTNDIFDLFERDSFIYRVGDEKTKYEYTEKMNQWTVWCNELAAKVAKFETPIIQSWQNSGQIARYFWTRLKYTPFLNSAACVSLHAYSNGFAMDVSYEKKNNNSELSKEEYNKFIIENLDQWVEVNNIDKNLFVISVNGGKNKCTLTEYYSNLEKRNWFKNTQIGINIDVGVEFSREEFTEFDSSSSKIISILESLGELYEKVQKPNKYYDTLKVATELVPDLHDGSYELVRETVRAFKAVAPEKLNIDDLNALFFMSVGTFRRSMASKKKLVEISNLPTNEKQRINKIMDDIEAKAKNNIYSNHVDGIGHVGMFGVGFMTFDKGDIDINIAKEFIKLCIEISDLNNDEEMFNLAEKVLSNNLKGIGTGSASTFLHCLKPYTFPILNGKQGDGTTTYDVLGIKLQNAKELKFYIQNARAIKEYRDKYFGFKNYRVMDIIKKDIPANTKYWLGGASYDDGDVSQNFINNNVFAIGWVNEDIKSILSDAAKLEQVFDKYNLNDNARKMFSLLLNIQAGDKIAIKSAFAKGKTSVLRIKAIGTVQNNVVDGYVYDKELFHTIPVEWEIIEPFDLEDIGGYLRTLHQVVKHEHIQRIFYSKITDKGIQDFKAYITEIIAVLKSFGGEASWEQICEVIEQRKQLHDIEAKIDWRNAVNLYLRTNCSDCKQYKGKNDLFTHNEYSDVWGLREIQIQPPNIYTKEDFLREAYITENKYNTIISRLDKKKNIILQGSPGVGKSFLAKKLAYSILGCEDKEKVQMIQFHQSYSYEDFIMGYRPNEKGGFEVKEGLFYDFCKKAISNTNPSDKYFFIIDEINRGNLSKIFGELMLLIEADKRGIDFEMSTVYSNEKFYIPVNIYIIGLMNTADRSLAMLDYALRRRFSFIDIEPSFGENFVKYTEQFNDTKLEEVIKVIVNINDDIEKDDSLGKGFKIGHSYFCNLITADTLELCEIIECEIIPLLEEYWFDNINKVKDWTVKLNEALIDG